MSQGKTIYPTALANGTMAFDLTALNPGPLTMRYNAGFTHTLLLLLQGLLWAFSFLVLFRRRSRKSGSRQSQLLQVERIAALAIEEAGPAADLAADDDYLDFSGTGSSDDGGGLAVRRKAIPRSLRLVRETEPSEASEQSEPSELSERSQHSEPSEQSERGEPTGDRS